MDRGSQQPGLGVKTQSANTLPARAATSVLDVALRPADSLQAPGWLWSPESEHPPTAQLPTGRPEPRMQGGARLGPAGRCREQPQESGRRRSPGTLLAVPHLPKDTISEGRETENSECF